MQRINILFVGDSAVDAADKFQERLKVPFTRVDVTEFTVEKPYSEPIFNGFRAWGVEKSYSDDVYDYYTLDGEFALAKMAEFANRKSRESKETPTSVAVKPQSPELPFDSQSPKPEPKPESPPSAQIRPQSAAKSELREIALSPQKSLVKTEVFEVGEHGLQPRTFDQLFTVARILAGSTIFGKKFNNKAEDALIALQYGKEIGLDWMTAANDIDLIEGKPCLPTATMKAIACERGYVDRFEDVITGEIESETRSVTCRAWKDAKIIAESTYTAQDAVRAGLWNSKTYSGKPSNWIKRPDRMLIARAGGNLCRDTFPQLYRGFRTTEEMLDVKIERIRDLTSNQTAKIEIKN
ncbi:MAG: hypothetical protein Q8O94_03130 [bacterium]|nr:hypothetical protein [bacterium]